MSNIILSFKELNELKNTIYATAAAHGFHDEKLTVEHCLGLVLSEIGEAINADRNPDAPIVTEATIEQEKRLADQDLGRAAFVEFFKSNIKCSVIEELADVAIRILDLAGMLGIAFDEDLEVDYLEPPATFPDRLFGFSMTLENLYFENRDQDDFISCLASITSIAYHFTHLDLWQVVCLKMIYNKTRPTLHGKKY